MIDDEPIAAAAPPPPTPAPALRAAHREQVRRARACTLCAESLPHGPRPVFVADPRARILIVGQAPSRTVHATGIPWSDASGRRLRQWLGLSEARFYDPAALAILPVGLCYPGSAARGRGSPGAGGGRTRGGGGDLPPRPECAPRWLAPLRRGLVRVRLTLAVGGYAQRALLGAEARAGVTHVVSRWRTFAPALFPTPHPSPRNTAWLGRHPWFEAELLPALRRAVARALV